MGDDDEYVVDFEVVEDADTSDDYQAAEKPRLIIPPAPVHPLSSLVTIVLDSLWGPLEVGATVTVPLALIPLILICGATCFVSVMLIQRYVDHDAWGGSNREGNRNGNRGRCSICCGWHRRR